MFEDLLIGYITSMSAYCEVWNKAHKWSAMSYCSYYCNHYWDRY